jgi:predicted kinase
MVDIMKKLILVTSPPACGKTFVTRKLAKAMPNCVYLDKDTLITLSKQIFVVANEEYNRSSDFFEAQIRDPEYDCVMELAMEALEYNDTVFINAPYTREVRTPGYMEQLRQQLLKKKGAELVVVWVQCDKEVCRQRMIHRNSDRDTWKLANWDEYISKQNFTVPEGIKNLFLFDNSTDDSFKKSIEEAKEYLNNLK